MFATNFVQLLLYFSHYNYPWDVPTTQNTTDFAGDMKAGAEDRHEMMCNATLLANASNDP